MSVSANSHPTIVSLRTLLAVIAVSAFSLLALAGFKPAAAGATTSCTVNKLSSFTSNDLMPGACWRPYSDSSPFNTRVHGIRKATASSSAPSSQTSITQLSSAPAASIVAGDPGRPDGIAVYYSKPSDPVYTLHCTENWGTCPIEGMQVHLHSAALAAGASGTDAHLTVVDPSTGWEYDLWEVISVPKHGGTLKFGWGGRIQIAGDGLGSYAVAARFGSLAGLIRPEELVSGHIHHALQMFVPCTEGFVYPADHPGYDCTDNGMSASHAPPMGAHFVLHQSVRSIRAGGYPKWKRAVLLALRRYGAYVADTTGDASYWGFRTQSSSSYISLGKPDPLVTMAKRKGMDPSDYNHNGWNEYWYDLGSGVDWSKLATVPSCDPSAGC